MLSRRVEAHSPKMLQSYNEGYSDLSYGQHLQMAPPSEYHHAHSWYNNYIHGGSEHQNGGIDYLNRGEEKHAPDWGYRPDSTLEPDSSYQSPPDNGYTGQQVGPIIPQLPIDSPMMGQMMQEPMMLPPESHNGAVSLLQNGTDRIESQPQKEEGDSLPKLNGPHAMPVEKKDVLKLPGFHQTFGNITEIGRFSQPDEFFESRPPEILDPPPKVSESLEVKRKPRGRKRKQPEPRELYSRPDTVIPPPCAAEPQWPAPPHHWPPPEPPHHWHRPHPYYHGQQHYHHHHQYQQPPYYHHQHHLDCPPPPYHYGHYQPNPWHPAAREYVHHHSYSGYV